MANGFKMSNMNFHNITLLLLFLLFSSTSYAQQSFNIDKRGKVKRVKYYPGQQIQLSYSSIKIKGQLVGLTDSALIVNDVTIPVAAIDYVIHPRQAFIWVFIRKVGYRAAIGYALLDGGTRVANNASPIIDDHLLKVTVPLLSAGIIGSIMKNRRYRNKGYNMGINDLSMP